MRNLFVLLTVVASVVCLSCGRSHSCAAEDAGKAQVQLKVGVCSDVHHDLIPDGCRRMSEFIDAMKTHQCDMIVQLGDFCVAKRDNDHFMAIWNQFPGPRYHVLGNHDTDGGGKPLDVFEFWGRRIPAETSYYSFDEKGYHFVVLNGNDRNPTSTAGGYSRHIGTQQQQWLEENLRANELPCIVLCHQPLDDKTNGGIDNSADVRAILERHNASKSSGKVRIVLTGHLHSDYHVEINGVVYVEINSMSYKWVVDAKYLRSRFDAATESRYRHLKNCLMYQEPLWAVLTIYHDGRWEIRGRESSFMPPTPDEMQMPPTHGGVPVSASISDVMISD